MSNLHSLLAFPHNRRDFRQFWIQTQAAIGQGNLAQALAMGRLFALQPSAPNIIRYAYGCLMIMAGYVEEGRQFVSAVGSFRQGNNDYSTAFFGYQADVPIKKSLIQEIYLRKSVIEAFKKTDFLLVSACDQVYFDRFYTRLLRSVKSHHSTVQGLVFLTVNDETKFKEVSALVQDPSLDNVIPIKFSTTLCQKDTKVGYSCARWCALDLLMDHLSEGQKLLIADVDMVQMRRFEYLDQSNPEDIGLLLYPSELMNLVAYCSGSLVTATVGTKSKQFIREVHRVINHAYDQNLLGWHLDQFAILMAYLNNRSTSLKIFPHEYVLSEPFTSNYSAAERGNAVFHSTTASTLNDF